MDSKPCRALLPLRCGVLSSRNRVTQINAQIRAFAGWNVVALGVAGTPNVQVFVSIRCHGHDIIAIGMLQASTTKRRLY